MIRKIASLSSLALLVFATGCATPPPPPQQLQDPVAIALEKVIAEGVEQPIHSVNADTKAVPAKMNGDRITIRSYVGDAANLLNRLAKARGMVFKINGPEPRLPLLVTVDVESVSLNDLLTEVGFQFGQRADLVLGDKRIEIRYRGQP